MVCVSEMWLCFLKFGNSPTHTVLFHHQMTWKHNTKTNTTIKLKKNIYIFTKNNSSTKGYTASLQIEVRGNFSLCNWLLYTFNVLDLHQHNYPLMYNCKQEPTHSHLGIHLAKTRKLLLTHVWIIFFFIGRFSNESQCILFGSTFSSNSRVSLLPPHIAKGLKKKREVRN